MLTFWNTLTTFQLYRYIVTVNAINEQNIRSFVNHMTTLSHDAMPCIALNDSSQSM